MARSDLLLKKKVGCTKVAELRDRDTWALSRITDCFQYRNKITYLKNDTQKNTCKMFLPQTTQAQKGPLIIPVTIRITTPPPPPTSPG